MRHLAFPLEGWILGFLLTFSALGQRAARAASPELSARLECEPVLGPGRVRCTLSLEVPNDQRLTWADALVFETPAMARPLRTRVPYRGSTRQSKIAIQLALLASASGRGTLGVRGRAVACPRKEAAGRCRPVQTEATLELAVGR